MCRKWIRFLKKRSDLEVKYLMIVDELEFYDEIECIDLFEGNDQREEVEVFLLPCDRNELVIGGEK